ncbi:hypothetical protein F01_550067 [Burkholderia cenocepacia]|nr:hypothetical protein F01_550067 [Burkholderia cenocepacia]
MTTLAPCTRNHDGFDVGNAGMQGSDDRLVSRPKIQCAGINHDEIGLHAGKEAADAVEHAHGAGTLHRHPRQCLFACDGTRNCCHSCQLSLDLMIKTALMCQGDPRGDEDFTRDS